MANPTELAVAYISILPSIVGLESRMQAALAPLQGQANTAGAKAGEGFSASFGTSMKNSVVAVDKLTASTKPLTAAIAGVGENAKVMGASLNTAATSAMSGVDRLNAATKPLAASMGTVAGQAKAMGAGVAVGSSEGVTALERLQAAATIAGDRAAGAMRTYTAAAEQAAGGNAGAIASLDRFGAEATIQAAKAQDAMRAYAVAAETSGAEAGAGLARGVAVGSKEAEGSLVRSTELIKGLAGGLLAGFAIGGAMELFKDAAKAAQDDAEGARLIKVAFGDASESVQKFSENAATSFGMSTGEADKAAAKFGQFLAAFKITGQQAADISTSLIGRSADIAKATGQDVGTVEAAIQSGLKGRANALKQFGIDINPAILGQEAFTHGIADQGVKLNDTQKALAVYYAIMDQSAGKAGAFVASGDTIATQQQQLKANFEDISANLGKAVMPALSALGSILVDVVVPGLTGLIGLFDPVLKAFEGMPKPVQDIVAGLGLLILLRGPLTSMFTAAVTGVRNFGASVAATAAIAAESGVEITTLGAVTRTAGMVMGSALNTAMGGIGLILTAVTAGMFLFGGSNDDAAKSAEANKAAVDSLSGTLDTLTGKLTAASAVKIGQDWVVAGVADQFKGITGGAAGAAASMVQGADAIAKVRKELLDSAGGWDTYSKNANISSALVQGFSEAAAQAGISSQDLVLAVLKGGPAFDALAETMQAANKASGHGATDIGILKHNLSAVVGALDPAVTGLKTYNEQVTTSGTASQIAADTIAIQKKTTDDLAKSNAALASSTGDVLAGLNGTGREASEAQGKLTDYKSVMDAISSNNHASQFIMPVAAKDSVTGLIDMYSQLGGSLVQIQTADDGSRTATTALATQYQHLQAEISGTTAEAGLFLSAMEQLAGQNVPMQQALDSQSASVLAIGAGMRDQAAAITAVTTAQEALKTAQAGHVGTQADVNTAQGNSDSAVVDLTAKQDALTKAQKDGKTTAAQLAVANDDVANAQDKVAVTAKDLATAQHNLGKQTQGGAAYTADVAAKTRDLAAAQATVAAGAPNLRAKLLGLETSTSTLLATTVDAADKAHGYNAAIAAGKKVMDDARASAIQQIATQGGTVKATAASTKAAEKLATAYGLIPGNVETVIKADPHLANESIDATAKAKAALVKQATLKFNANTKGAIADIAAFGGDVASIPKSYRTVFNAEVATASKNGQNLYNVYNKTTGNWTAQFLTPNQAAAKLKVGYLVDQYDKAKGTWTAKFATPNEAAAKSVAIGVVSQYDKARGVWAATFATPNQAAAKSVAIGVVSQYDKARGTWTANLSALDSASTIIGGVHASLNAIHDKTVNLTVNAMGIATPVMLRDGSFRTGSGAIARADGGYISGPGGPREDKIHAMVSNGEFIINAASTAKNLPLLTAINNRYADGGLVGGQKTIVNMSASGNIDAAMNATNSILATAQRSGAALVAAANAAAAAAAAAGSQAASGLLGSQDPSSFGWGVGQNIVPFSFHGIDFPAGVAAGTSSIWSSFLTQLEPMIIGGIRPGEDWGFDNRANVNSPGQKSFHAYGLALDVNAPENGNGTNPGNGPGQVPLAAGALARRYNMLWGGEFSGTKDPMHFELHESPQQLSGGGAAGAALGGASSGAIANLSGSGVERWRALATKVAMSKGEDLASVQVMLNQMSRESSGNPRAINLTDINAQRGTPSVGLLQFIPATFSGNADPGYNTNIYDPESQMRAWYNYINGKYSGYAKFGQRGYGAYADGGLVRGAGSGRSDSNLARVSNGEYIVNADATAANLSLLHSINGYANGGLIGSATTTALSGRTAASLGPEMSNVVQALQDIAQAVLDARAAVAPKHDLEAQAWSALNAAKQQQWDNQIAAHNVLKAARDKQGTEDAKTSTAERTRDRQVVANAERVLSSTVAADNAAVAKADREYRDSRRTALSYDAAARAAERFQSAQQRAYRAQQTYAAQVDKLNGWLTDRSAKLGQLQSNRSQMMGGISSTISGFDGGILGHPDTRNTFATILKGQQYDAAQAQKFNVDITKLRALGLSNGSLNSIASAGVDGGGVTAAALAKATPAQIKQLNAVGNQMHRIGDNVGNVVGGAFYDAGIQSATGFVKGLQSQIGAIQKAIDGYAGAAVGALTRRLQIHSPSQVFHKLGGDTAAGFVNGVTGGYDKVRRSVVGMVAIPASVKVPMAGSVQSARPVVQISVDRSDPLALAVSSMITAKIDGFTADLGHSLEKAGMQR